MNYTLIKNRDDSIIEQYLEKKQTTQILAKEFSMTYKNVLRILHKYKIPIRESRDGSKNLALGRGKKGKLNPNWKGGKILAGGYIWILNPQREGKKRMYIKEHRYVMEQFLERKLLKTELVHHKNGVKTDNRFENLEVLTFANHHGKVDCPYCQKEFSIR